MNSAVIDNPQRPALLVFSDDWGRHPSSCQHLIGRLLQRYRVHWMNTIGTRTPRFDLATVKRGFEKVAQWFRRGQKHDAVLPANLTVHNPRMWPWFTSPRDRRINHRLLLRALTPIVEEQGGPVTAITTIPVVADLVDELPVREWVYYCVDDFSVWPGLDQQTLLAMETELIQKADRIIAVSETLQERIRHAGRDAELLTHGVDLDIWRNPQPVDLPDLWRSLESPKIVFWGVVDRRMDTGFVRRLAGDLERGTIALVGPEQDPDPELAVLPRVVRVPAVPLESLSAIAADSDVLIMPYVDAEVTRAMQPLKLKEYLATGKPVVVRDLPATRCWDDCLDAARTPQEFSRLVQQRLRDGLPLEQGDARSRLTEEAWAGKAHLFEQFALQPQCADAVR